MKPPLSVFAGGALLAAFFLCGTPRDVSAQFGVTFHYQDYAAVLSNHVDQAGLVDYAALKENREPLDHFVRDISGLYIEMYEGWEKDEQLAFWINAYNALTLRVIIDHYPIEPDWKKRLLFPVGIRHIPGVWTKLTFNVKAEDMTLDQIEHEVIRKQFDEPRIHFALVCAAMGCPPLRNEPYRAEKLDAQLDDQTRRFLDHPEKFRIDHESRTLHLSPILEWYGMDFVTDTDEKDLITWGSEEERAVVTFLRPYLSDDDWQQLTAHEYQVNYLDYDWSLNEQPSVEQSGDGSADGARP